MPGQPFVQVDAFSRESFGGNPAAVFLLPSARDEGCEDPVTGSAHCALGPFWGGRLERTALTARQLAARGGTLWIRLEGDRVHLGGHAVTVLRGELV